MYAFLGGGGGGGEGSGVIVAVLAAIAVASVWGKVSRSAFFFQCIPCLLVLLFVAAIVDGDGWCCGSCCFFC